MENTETKKKRSIAIVLIVVNILGEGICVRVLDPGYLQCGRGPAAALSLGITC